MKDSPKITIRITIKETAAVPARSVTKDLLSQNQAKNSYPKPPACLLLFLLLVSFIGHGNELHGASLPTNLREAGDALGFNAVRVIKGQMSVFSKVGLQGQLNEYVFYPLFVKDPVLNHREAHRLRVDRARKWMASKRRALGPIARDLSRYRFKRTNRTNRTKSCPSRWCASDKSISN